MLSDSVTPRYGLSGTCCRGFNTTFCNLQTQMLTIAILCEARVEWNQLDTEVVRAETVESFREALTRCYSY